jgi:hypothetical protein
MRVADAPLIAPYAVTVMDGRGIAHRVVVRIE